MYLGKIVELGRATSSTAAAAPVHAGAAVGRARCPTRSRARRKRIVLKGDVPSPATRRRAAASAPAAPARRACAPRRSRRYLQVEGGEPGHLKACHFPVADGEELARQGEQAQGEQAGASLA